MAQSNRENANVENATIEKATPIDAASLWAIAAAAANYDVHNGAPLNGISGDVGHGFIVQFLPVPQGFEAILDETARMNAFRAHASYALRIGQAAVKASKAPTREIAQAAVSSALAGTYKPGRDVDNGIIGSEAAKDLRGLVRANILPQIAAKVAAGEMEQPTEAEIEAEVESQIKAFLKTPRGEAKRQELRAAVIERGTYAVSRKKGEAKPIAGIAVNF